MKLSNLLFLIAIVASMSSATIPILISSQPIVFNNSLSSSLTQTISLYSIDAVDAVIITSNITGLTLPSSVPIPANTMNSFVVTASSLPNSVQQGTLQVAILQNVNGTEMQTQIFNISVTADNSTSIVSDTAILQAEIPGHTIYKDVTDSDYTVNDKFDNLGSEAITITNVILEPEVNWFTLQSFDYPRLAPGDQAIIPVLIKPSLAKAGSYTGSLTVKAKSNVTNSVLTVAVPYNINFAGTAGPTYSTEPIGTLTTIVEPFALVNTPITIQFNGVAAGDEVTPLVTPARAGDICNAISNTPITGSVWTGQCTIQNQGAYTLSARIVRGANTGVAPEANVLVGYTITDLGFAFDPHLKPDQPSKISLVIRDTNESIYQNAPIKVNDVLVTDRTMIPSAGITYKVCADLGSNYQACDNVQAEYRALTITIPQTIFGGDQITTLIQDAETGVEIANATIMVNGQASDRVFTANSGALFLQVTSEGYSPGVVTRNVLKLPTVLTTNVQPFNPESGDEVTVPLSESSPYEVKLNGTTIASGTSDRVVFTAGIGEHDILSQGRTIYTLNISEKPFWNRIEYQVAGVIIALFIIYLLWRRRSKSAAQMDSGSAGFTMGSAGIGSGPCCGRKFRRRGIVPEAFFSKLEKSSGVELACERMSDDSTLFVCQSFEKTTGGNSYPKNEYHVRVNEATGTAFIEDGSGEIMSKRNISSRDLKHLANFVDDLGYRL